MNLNESEIKEAVIAQGVAQLVDQFSSSEKIQKAIEVRAVGLIEQEITVRIDAILKEKLELITFDSTNPFGETMGRTQTMREFIDAHILKHIHQPVDYQGKATEERYGNKEPRLNFLVKEATSKAIDEMVKSAATAIRSQIGAMLGNEVKTKIDQTLKALDHRG